MDILFQCQFDGDLTCARLGGLQSTMAVGFSDQVVVIGKSSRTDFPIHPSAVCALTLDRTDTTLASGCEGGSLWLLDVAGGRQTATLAGHRAACSTIEFHPFGSILATGGADSNVKLWDSRQAKCVQTYRSHGSAVTAVQFSPHGRWLASGDDEGSLKLWDLAAGRCLSDIAHLGPVAAIDFHPNDFFVLTADQTVKVWACEAGLELAASSSEKEGWKKVGFSPSGASLAIASLESIKTFSWDPASRRIACTHEIDCARELSSGGSLLDVKVEERRVLTASARGSRLTIYEATRNVDLKPPRMPSPPTMCTDSSSVEISQLKSVLSRRLMSVRTVCSLWAAGNTKAAVSEAIAVATVDPTVFVCLLAALPTERTKSAMSIETCSQILSHILTAALLTSDQPSHTKLLPNKSTDNAFTVKVALEAVVHLSCRFEGILSEIQRAEKLLTPTTGSDFSRDERTARAQSCRDLFAKLVKVLEADVRSTKLLKREKEEAIKNIVLIQ